MSTLRQLTQVLSNNSRFLHIQVDEFTNNRKLLGTRISVVHEELGVLFCTVMNATGDLITSAGDTKQEDWVQYNLSMEQLWNQLEKFGFYVDYKLGPDISNGQLEYLLELKKLGYRKIRYISIWHVNKLGQRVFDSRVVAFRADKLPDWMNSSYAPKKEEYFDAIERGWAFNVSAQVDTKKYNWTFLRQNVIDIDDLAFDATTDQSFTQELKDPGKIKLSIPETMKFKGDD